MTTKTELCNLAVSHLGIGDEIANLETEDSAEASACRRFFTTAFETFQRDFNYSFETKSKVLGLISSDPNDRYLFEYEYPSDCAIAGRIISGLITDNRQSQVPFVIVRGTSGRVIHSNWEDAELEYQFLDTESGRFPADAIMTFSYKLAELIAPRVTAGDPFGLGDKAERHYEKAKGISESNNLNEQQEEEEPLSEFIRVREHDTGLTRGEDWQAFPDNSTIL